MDKAQKGSITAKHGFKNEDDVINRFNNWRYNKIAKSWLSIMNYNLEEIDNVKAIKIHGYKTDVQIQVTIQLKNAIDVENLQVKLVSNPKGYNQIDKRWVKRYSDIWGIPNNIISILYRYTGEDEPTIDKPKDIRRMFANEFSKLEQIALIDWLSKNQALIITDILKGRGKFAAEWMLVAQRIDTNARWTLKPMNYCLNFFGNGEIKISKIYLIYYFQISARKYRAPIVSTYNGSHHYRNRIYVVSNIDSRKI